MSRSCKQIQSRQKHKKKLGSSSPIKIIDGQKPQATNQPTQKKKNKIGSFSTINIEKLKVKSKNITQNAKKMIIQNENGIICNNL